MPVISSISEIDALVCKSVDLKTVWPVKFKGFPDIFSATIRSRLI